MLNLHCNTHLVFIHSLYLYYTGFEDVAVLDENGKYNENKLIKLNVKFENEGRFGIGCAKIQRHDCNSPSGVIMKPFDYSGKRLISIPDYETKKLLEFCRIRSLSTKS